MNEWRLLQLLHEPQAAWAVERRSGRILRRENSDIARITTVHEDANDGETANVGNYNNNFRNLFKSLKNKKNFPGENKKYKMRQYVSLEIT